MAASRVDRALVGSATWAGSFARGALRARLAVLCALLCPALVPSAARAQCAEASVEFGYIDVAPSTTQSPKVTGMVEWEREPGVRDVVIAGFFAGVGTIPAQSAARWDGSFWHAMNMPTATSTDFVRRLVVFQNEVYAVGNIPALGSLIKWDGSAWVTVHPVSGLAKDATVFNGELIFCGNLTDTGTGTPFKLGAWNGTAFRRIEPDAFAPTADLAALEAVDGSLAIGGSIGTLYGVPAGSVATWSGGTISDLGNLQAPAMVTGLAHREGRVIAAGPGTPPSPRVVEFVNGAWQEVFQPLVTSPLSPELQVEVDNDGSVLVAMVNRAQVQQGVLDRWDGTARSVVTSPSPVFCITPGTTSTLFGGARTINSSMTSICGRVQNGIYAPLRIAPTALLSSEFLPTIATSAGSGANMFVGGSFKMGWPSHPQNIARFNGTTWEAMGGFGPSDNTISPQVPAIATFAGETYAASFRFLGAPSALRRWNGTTWDIVATCAPSTLSFLGIYVFTEYQDGLVAAGLFNAIDGVPAVNIAVMHGATWAPLGSGSNGAIDGARVFRGELVVCGRFNVVGGVTANGIAAWDGVSWRSLGTPSGFRADAMAEYRGNLVVVRPTPIGAASRFVVWDGTSWSTLHDASVTAPTIANTYYLVAEVYQGDLFIGGEISAVGTQPANGLARWDGRAWHAVHNNIPATFSNRVISHLRATPDGLVVGGGLVMGPTTSSTLDHPYFAILTDREFCSACDSVDFNGDGLFPDTLDIDDFLSVMAGGLCAGQQAGDAPCNADIDFNDDGVFPDTLDIDALLTVFAGGVCP